MIQKDKAVRLAVGLVAAMALVSACSSGSGTRDTGLESGSSQAAAAGVTENEYGGAQLAVGDPRRGGELKIGMISPIDSLDPTTALSTSANSIAIAIFEPLMKVEADGTVSPELAESLDSSDAQRWTLKLRDGVKFTDGTNFNADAVMAHIERYKAPETTARDAGQARQITNATKVDDLTVELELARPNLDFPLVLTGQFGMVPSPTALQQDPKRFGLNPVGAGPFKIESLMPGGDVVLVRNADYYDSTLPYLDKLTMVTAQDGQARLSALEAGSLDLAPTTSPADFAKAEAAGLKVLEQPLFTYQYLTLNLSKAPFDDPVMRKAVIQAIDTQALSTAVFEGLASPMKGWFSPNHPAYVEVDYPAFDPEAAKKAVAEYKAKGGSTALEIQMIPSPANSRAVAIIQQMLQDVGIVATVAALDQPTSILNASNGNYEAIYRFIGITLAAVSDLNNRFRTGSAGTITHAGSAALDQTITTLSQTPVADRADLYATAQKQLAEWMPSVPLVQQVGGWIVTDAVGGFPGSRGEQTVDMVRLKYIWAQ